MFTSVTRRSLLFFLFLLVHTNALRHLHKGQKLHDDGLRTLRGFMHSSTNFRSDISTLSAVVRQRAVHFEAQIKKDMLFWDELEDHDMKVKTCFQRNKTGEVGIEITGENLDPSDFLPGVAFLIDVEHWKTFCHEVPSFSGIDRDDPILFYKINKATRPSFRSVRLHMTAIHGSEVVPTVKVSFVNNLLKNHTKKRFTFDDNPLYPVITRMLNAEDIISPGEIIHPNFEQPDMFSETVILPGSNITASGFLEGAFDNFRITRLFQLEVGWTQTLKADVASRLVAKSKYHASNEREVYRRHIPDAYYSERLLFFGRLTVRAFSIVDFVQELQIDSGIDAYVRATTENVHAVTASFSSRQLDAESLLPPDYASYGTFDIHFDNTTEQTIAFSGFFGARPAILVEASLSGTSMTGKFSATLGLEASLVYRDPPFSSLSLFSSVVGSCDQCHGLQGSASVKGKDLQYYVHQNGELVKHKILDSNLFQTELTTVCALPKTCSVQ